MTFQLSSIPELARACYHKVTPKNIRVLDEQPVTGDGSVGVSSVDGSVTFQRYNPVRVPTQLDESWTNQHTNFVSTNHSPIKQESSIYHLVSLGALL
jgi:hypothetical protein